MTKRIAVVTGGAGFIGSHMVDLLIAEGFSVRVIDNLSTGQLKNLEHLKNNPQLSIDQRDICTLTPGDPLFAEAQYVFHFAGLGDIVPSIDKPMEYCRVNTMGTVAVLECARAANVEKFVYAASSSCYGADPELPTTERSPVSPQYPYALSKYLGEEAVLHWGLVYKLPVMSIRIFNAYGPRARTTGAYGAVFGVFLRQKLANAPFTVVGDGNQKRDFIFVTDLAQAFLAAARANSHGEVVNVGAGAPQTINRLVELLNGAGVVHLPKRPGEPDCTWADITKAKQLLNWEPRVSFEEGTKRMLDVIDYWRDAPLWNPDTIAEATEGWFKALS